MILCPELQEPGGGLFELAEMRGLGCVERGRGLVGELIKHVCARSAGAGSMLHHASR